MPSLPQPRPLPAPQPLVPYQGSPLWREHDAYYARRGVRAFLDGEVPYLSTSNYAAARRAAALLVAQVEALSAEGRLAGDAEVAVLEVGGGLGRFAANFLRALDGDLGAAGRSVGARLRYVFSDYSAPTVRQAAAGAELAPFVAGGRVVPALFDCRHPGGPRALDGRPVRRGFLLVLASYVCCVLPTWFLQKRGARWSQLLVRSDGSDEESSFAWSEPRSLSGLPHARTLAALTAGFDEATLPVPVGFLDFLLGARPLLDGAGSFLVQDYGTVERAALRGLHTALPRRYGESLNHGVAFPVLDAFAATHGMAIARTENPLDATHAALLRPRGTIAPTVARAFEERFIARNNPQDLLDFACVGRQLLGERDGGRALRFFDRALALDPYHPELYLRAGEAALLAELPDVAADYLLAGQALDGWRAHDFAPALAAARAAIEAGARGSDE